MMIVCDIKEPLYSKGHREIPRCHTLHRLV
jgi:hypothetical protein